MHLLILIAATITCVTCVPVTITSVIGRAVDAATLHEVILRAEDPLLDPYSPVVVEAYLSSDVDIQLDVSAVGDPLTDVNTGIGSHLKQYNFDNCAILAHSTWRYKPVCWTGQSCLVATCSVLNVTRGIGVRVPRDTIPLMNDVAVQVVRENGLRIWDGASLPVIAGGNDESNTVYAFAPMVESWSESGSESESGSASKSASKSGSVSPSPSVSGSTTPTFSTSVTPSGPPLSVTRTVSSTPSVSSSVYNALGTVIAVRVDFSGDGSYGLRGYNGAVSTAPIISTVALDEETRFASLRFTTVPPEYTIPRMYTLTLCFSGATTPLDDMASASVVGCLDADGEPSSAFQAANPMSCDPSVTGLVSGIALLCTSVPSPGTIEVSLAAGSQVRMGRVVVGRSISASPSPSVTPVTTESDAPSTSPSPSPSSSVSPRPPVVPVWVATYTTAGLWRSVDAVFDPVYATWRADTTLGSGSPAANYVIVCLSANEASVTTSWGPTAVQSCGGVSQGVAYLSPNSSELNFGKLNEERLPAVGVSSDRSCASETGIWVICDHLDDNVVLTIPDTDGIGQFSLMVGVQVYPTLSPTCTVSNTPSRSASGTIPPTKSESASYTPSALGSPSPSPTSAPSRTAYPSFVADGVSIPMPLIAFVIVQVQGNDSFLYAGKVNITRVDDITYATSALLPDTANVSVDALTLFGLYFCFSRDAKYVATDGAMWSGHLNGTLPESGEDFSQCEFDGTPQFSGRSFYYVELSRERFLSTGFITVSLNRYTSSFSYPNTVRLLIYIGESQWVPRPVAATILRGTMDPNKPLGWSCKSMQLRSIGIWWIRGGYTSDKTYSPSSILGGVERLSATDWQTENVTTVVTLYIKGPSGRKQNRVEGMLPTVQIPSLLPANPTRYGEVLWPLPNISISDGDLASRCTKPILEHYGTDDIVELMFSFPENITVPSNLFGFRLTADSVRNVDTNRTWPPVELLPVVIYTTAAGDLTGYEGPSMIQPLFLDVQTVDSDGAATCTMSALEVALDTFDTPSFRAVLSTQFGSATVNASNITTVLYLDVGVRVNTTGVAWSSIASSGTATLLTASGLVLTPGVSVVQSAPFVGGLVPACPPRDTGNTTIAVSFIWQGSPEILTSTENATASITILIRNGTFVDNTKSPPLPLPIIDQVPVYFALSP